MKFLYCPSCKELRVKGWYSVRNRCARCLKDARAINIPSSWLTYLSYVLFVAIPVLVGIHVLTDSPGFLYMSAVGLVIMMIVSYLDVIRGEKIAKAKIKITSSDLDEFRRRGWT
ncbi:MAG: hypothetical protein ACUVT7_06640 [Thermoplasmata archaeon]